MHFNQNSFSSTILALSWVKMKPGSIVGFLFSSHFTTKVLYNQNKELQGIFSKMLQQQEEDVYSKFARVHQHEVQHVNIHLEE